MTMATNSARRKSSPSSPRTPARSRALLLWVTVGLLIAGIAGAVVWQLDAEKSRVAPSSVALPEPVTASDGYSVGRPNAPVKLDVYEDFQCPACGKFEKAVSAQLGEKIAAGTVLATYHTMAFLGPESYRAANAAACANTFGKFSPFHTQLFAHQPVEKTNGYTTPELIAAGAAVGITDPAFAACVNDGRYTGFVDKVNASASAAGVTATPHYAVNGTVLAPDARTPEGLLAAIATAAGR